MSPLQSNTKQQNKEQKSGLTARQKAIIEILTKFTATNPVTISAISEKLKLSSRTILRELPAIEGWLSENQFRFLRKPGVGLVLEESLENQKKILQLLDMETVEKVYSKEERRKLLLGELLAVKEPRKSFYFTSRFQISEGTLSNDLDDLGKWLSAYEIKIIRKQGLGIYLEGSEESYRQAIANIVYDFMEEKEILNLLGGRQAAEGVAKLAVPANNRLLCFLDEEIVNVVESLLIEVEQKRNIKYTDSAYIGLVVHISLAIKRIQNLENIEMEQKKLQQLLEKPEFSVAEEIAGRLANAFGIKIPLEEVGFITIHLLSAKVWFLGTETPWDTKRTQVRQIVAGMIAFVEQALGISLKESEGLYEDLERHILPVVSRLSMNVRIKNAQLQTIKENYTEVFEVTRKACVLLQEAIGVAEIPEAEIAFIAMHFCAAIEKMHSKEKEIFVAVVCPTGMGTSRMLAANLKKSFYNVEICYILSALHIDTEKLAEDGIDLVVSTVELDIDYTYACVSPVLMEQDKLLLKNMIKTLQKAKTVKAVTQKKYKKYGTKQDIIFMTNIGTEIIQILNHIRFFVIQQIEHPWELLHLAGRLFTEEKEKAEQVSLALQKREEKADTYISSLEVMLFHCMTDVVDHCRLGYIGLRKPFLREGGIVRGAVVMLTPKGDKIGGLEVMSAVSGALIESKQLMQHIHDIDQNAFVVELEQHLCRYYEKAFENRKNPQRIL